MTALGGFCLGVSFAFLVCAPAIEDHRVAQLRAIVVLVFALVGVALL